MTEDTTENVFEAKAKEIADSVLHGKFHFAALVPAIASALEEAVREESQRRERAEEELECLRMVLDDAGVSDGEGDQKYSTVGRVNAFVKRSVAEERREIMNLLGMDENGNGLTSTSSWLAAVGSGSEPEAKQITICHDPCDQLDGALIDLRRQDADKICIATIESVQEGLANVAKRAAAIRDRS